MVRDRVGAKFPRPQSELPSVCPYQLGGSRAGRMPMREPPTDTFPPTSLPAHDEAGSASGIDLAQVVAAAAQEALSSARRRGLHILFDYRGPTPQVVDTADPCIGDAIRTVADCMLSWIIRSTRAGPSHSLR